MPLSASGPRVSSEYRMPKTRHICFFTGKRGGFTHLIPILEAIEEVADLEYSIIAADMHLSDTFGRTIDEVGKWVSRIYRIDTMFSSDSKVSRAKSIGIGIINFSQILETNAPDMVFVLGDRGEVLALTISAMELNIPIAHLFGGDVSQAGVDEPVRHAITKMANIHFTSNHESSNRIIKMGEEPWRVHTVGSPVLDLIKKHQYTPPDIIQKKFRFDLEKPILVALQHSVTWQVEAAEFQMRQTMQAIEHLGYQTVAIYPCSDPGYEDIIRVLSEYQDRPYFQLHKNIPFLDFWGLLNVSDVFIGNSSAGLMETPSFRIPFVNIGIRQEGRLRAENVIDVDHGKDHIIDAIQTALYDETFRKTVRHCSTPYGDGTAAEQIVSILGKTAINERLLRKRMTY